MAKKSVVIVGTGWAGYTFLQDISCDAYNVIIISPEATSPYTPLLASAACGLFDFGLAEEPVRRAFDGATKSFPISYDYLVLAPGCVTNTFGTPGVEESAFFVRNVPDAKKVQQRIQQLLELASLPDTSEEQQRALLHIAVVGGGPTGVEISAELSDLFNNDFAKLYPSLAGKMSITIFDAAQFILGAFEQSLRDYAITSFSSRHVRVHTDAKILKVEQDKITVKGHGEVPCGMVLWVTGNKECALVDKLNVAKSDRLPRILTDDALRVLDANRQPMDNVFALGDAADIESNGLPTTAEVAVQKARFLARTFNGCRGFDALFTYRQKALVAYIGGHDGVVQGEAGWTGARAWRAWRAKNLFWTRSWRRKFMIVANWMWNWIDGRELARA
ncbi:hypothetical protein LMH87_001850 [Akanthomyces muscarius]|uniref:FAD/NAD(P)-binding domain-containing protein n=1 Tax=Akanthomyces muscarius TaxID=2231603 RepID=A0A9W8Q7C2_AKAMU|nr:hypothetical protein LMH87_001850 [Akanthomyces muscarius]KAJ4147318.1 hypothetical protein LMH87_001850 [Akanthomyces muscarius]